MLWRSHPKGMIPDLSVSKLLMLSVEMQLNWWQIICNVQIPQFCWLFFVLWCSSVPFLCFLWQIYLIPISCAFFPSLTVYFSTLFFPTADVLSTSHTSNSLLFLSSDARPAKCCTLCTPLSPLSHFAVALVCSWAAVALCSVDSQTTFLHFCCWAREKNLQF